MLKHLVSLFAYGYCLQSTLGASSSAECEKLIDPSAVCSITNPCNKYSLVNSVDFHPKNNLFCVTYTQGNRVAIYKMDEQGYCAEVQTLRNPQARLKEPQHAAFSPEGNKIAVVNWTNQTIAFYHRNEEGLFGGVPVAIAPPPSALKAYKPHGLAFSPHGELLAIAYGAASYYGRAIAIFRLSENRLGCDLVGTIKDYELPGIPKGITFSPDGTCLLVTFSDTHSLCIYKFIVDKGKTSFILHQVIDGTETEIFRPEDVKISPNGKYCAISNSEQHNLSIYSFDKNSNLITNKTSIYCLQNPQANLCFPHGVAFAHSHPFVLITEFGPVQTTIHGDISWESDFSSQLSGVKVYRTSSRLFDRSH